jgi:hypothetical protein
MACPDPGASSVLALKARGRSENDNVSISRICLNLGFSAVQFRGPFPQNFAVWNANCQ